MEQGIVRAVIARKSREKRALVKSEILQLFSEIHVGGGGDSICALPQVMLVAIEREDLSLGVAPLDFPGQENLLDLAVEGLFGREKQEARELLRDGARPFVLAHADDVLIGGAQHRIVVDPGVLEELVVFCGQNGVQIIGRNVFVGDHDAPLNGEFADNLAVVRINVGDDVGSIIFEPLDGRKAVAVAQQHSQRHADPQEEHNQKAVDDEEPEGKLSGFLPWRDAELCRHKRQKL